MDVLSVRLNAGETTTTNATTLVRKRERGSECSHKVIEKRRRDRINGCLHELSRLVPAARARQGSGKLEKAEILEMTVDYLKKIQLSQDEDCIQGLVELSGEKAPLSSKDQVSLKVKVLQSFRHGYNECMAEVQKFLCNDNGSAGEEPGNIPCLLNHLQLRLNEETSKATISEKVNSPPSTTSSQTPPTDVSPSTKHLPQQATANNHHEEAVKPETGQQEPPNKKQHLAPAGCIPLPPVPVTMSQDVNRITNNVALPAIVQPGVNTLTPAVQSQQSQQQLFHQPFVPAYALHPSGTHYIPIAIQPGVPITQIGVGNVGVIPAATIAPSVGMINAPFAVVSPGGMQFGAANGVVHGALTSTVASPQQKSLLCSIAENEAVQPDGKQDAGQSTLSESIATQTEISCKDEKTTVSPTLATQGQVELNMIALNQSF